MDISLTGIEIIKEKLTTNREKIDLVIEDIDNTDMEDLNVSNISICLNEQKVEVKEVMGEVIKNENNIVKTFSDTIDDCENKINNFSQNIDHWFDNYNVHKVYLEKIREGILNSLLSVNRTTSRIINNINQQSINDINTLHDNSLSWISGISITIFSLIILYQRFKRNSNTEINIPNSILQRVFTPISYHDLDIRSYYENSKSLLLGILTGFSLYKNFKK